MDATAAFDITGTTEDTILEDDGVNVLPRGKVSGSWMDSDTNAQFSAYNLKGGSQDEWWHNEETIDAPAGSSGTPIHYYRRRMAV